MLVGIAGSGAGTWGKRARLNKFKVEVCAAAIRPWFPFLGLSGMSASSELSALPGHGFDLGVKAAASQGLVLIQRHGEVGKRSII